MHLKLVTFDNGSCTVGRLYHRNEEICCTMEKSWKQNQKSISCIPAGEYDLIYRVSPSSGPTFYFSNPKLGVSLDDESGRTYIQIDAANIQSQLDGCIAVGEQFSYFTAEREQAVTHSKTAKNYLMEMLGKESHTIEIKRC